MFEALARVALQLDSTAGLAVRIERSGSSRAIEPQIADNLLRIGQEAATNAVRHAGASVISICLTFGAREVRLTVEDKGVGFDPHQRTEGSGLAGMRERARFIGAAFFQSSSPGAGSVVRVIVPTAADPTRMLLGGTR